MGRKGVPGPAQTRNTKGLTAWRKFQTSERGSVRPEANNPSIKALPSVVTSLTFRRRRLRPGAPLEAIGLRQMRVQLSDPALVESLLDHLRAHGCVVDQIDATVLAVWCPPMDCNDSADLLTCRSCGEPVAETLGRLGSLRCHDCRDEGGFETLLAGVYGHANGHAARARSDLAGYLAEWESRNPGANAVIR
jgi:hypothetical protein